MGVDRVDLPGAALEHPAYLGIPVESDVPCLREGWSQSQPCTNLRSMTSFAPPQSRIIHERSEVTPTAYGVHAVLLLTDRHGYLGLYRRAPPANAPCLQFQRL
jgi:hypothetical protein